jgi:hypothetical protein
LGKPINGQLAPFASTGLERKIGPDDLAGVIARLSAAVGGRLVLHEGGHRLGIKLGLALEIVVKAASGEPRPRHDFIDRHGRKAMTIEQLGRTLNDPLTDLRALTI